MSGQAKLHESHGLTFQRLGITSKTIYTLDPSNLRVIWATGFREWGVEATRMKILGTFCGRGIATVDGTLWERTRDLLRPHFYGMTAAPINLDIVEKYMSRYMLGVPDGKEIDFQPIIYDMYFEVGYEFLMGEPYSELPGFEEISVQTIRYWLDYGVVGSRRRFVQGPLKYFQDDREWFQVCTQMANLSQACIDRARSNIQAKNGKIGTNNEQMNLVDRFIQEFEDEVELRDLVTQYLMGTSFTVSSVVTNALYLLSEDAEVWEKLQEEVASREKMGLSVETLKNMPFAKKILDESLRLYPLTTLEVRTALKDTVLPTGGGEDGLAPIYTVKGTKTMTSIWALHRQPSVFGERVDDFLPDRWNSIQPSRWEYMPFGGGPRICIGQAKARAESVYILCRVAQIFKSINGCEGALKSRAGQDQLGCKVLVRRIP